MNAGSGGNSAVDMGSQTRGIRLGFCKQLAKPRYMGSSDVSIPGLVRDQNFVTTSTTVNLKFVSLSSNINNWIPHVLLLIIFWLTFGKPKCDTAAEQRVHNHLSMMKGKAHISKEQELLTERSVPPHMILACICSCFFLI